MENAVKTLIAKSIFAAAAAGDVPGLQISGRPCRWLASEPWCAFFEYDDVTVDCSYRTFEECTRTCSPARGTCGLNPAGPGP